MTATAIINPYKPPRIPELGPLAVMVATRDDLNRLVARLKMAPGTAQRIFTSRVYRGMLSEIPLAVAGPMMGAPYAAAILETLIAWGARRILFWGWCGGIAPELAHGDLILPTAALSAEGTSRHYDPALPVDGTVSPTGALLSVLPPVLEEAAIAHHCGAVWTTDAIFRETRDQISRLQAQNVLAVEMELSALFSVARFRGVEMAGWLVVSDLLSTLTWQPGFKNEAFQSGRDQALKGMLACLKALIQEDGQPSSPPGGFSR